MKGAKQQKDEEKGKAMEDISQMVQKLQKKIEEQRDTIEPLLNRVRLVGFHFNSHQFCRRRVRLWWKFCTISRVVVYFSLVIISRQFLDSERVIETNLCDTVEAA